MLITYQGNYLCIYPTPPPQAECDTRSIFKWSKACFNSGFLLLDWLPKEC